MARAGTKTGRFIEPNDDADRIIANLAYREKAVEYAVRSSLRRAAQYTVTNTRRRIARKHGVPQKLLRKRLGAFQRMETAAGKRVPYFRAWLGTKRMIQAHEAKGLAAQARARGAFTIPSQGPVLYLREGRERFPIRRAGLNLADEIEDMRRIGWIAWRRVYPRRLRRELQRRASKARTPGEARALERALSALLKRQERSGEIPDGNF